MIKANGAEVTWDPSKKQWVARIQIGAEVIKRTIAKQAAEAADESLRAVVVQTARDEGYELEPSATAIRR